jgi:PAS domain S-box-containing protein
MHDFDQRVRSIIEHLPDALLVLDAEGRITWAGPSARLLGMDPANAPDSLFELLRGDDVDRFRQGLNIALACPGEPIAVRAVRVQVDGARTAHFDHTLTYLPDAPGIRGVMTVAREVPDLASPLAADGERRPASADLDQDAVFTSDATGRFQYVNRAAAAALGSAPEEIVGRPVGDFLPPTLLREYRSDIERVMRTGEDLVVEDQSQVRGRDIWLSTIVQPVRDSGGRVTDARLIARDVTDLKVAERALRESEERLRQVVRLSGIGLFDHDHVTGEIYWSPQQREIYGWGPDEPVLFSRSGSQWETWNLIHPEDRARLDAAVEHAHQAADGQFEIEYRIIRRDGTLRWVSTRSQTFFESVDGTRRAVRTIGAVQDITERKLAERQLRLTQTAVDRSNTSIFWLSAGGQVTYANDHACESLGRTREELLKLHVWDFDPQMTPQRWTANADARRQRRLMVSLSEHQRKDGTVFPVEVIGDYLVFDGEEHIFVFAQDVSERQRAERQLQLLSAAFNNSRMPFFASGPTGQVLYANEYACHSLGLARDQLIGSHVWDFDPNVTPEGYRRLWEQLKKEGIVVIQSRHRRNDGTIIPVEVTSNYFAFKGEEYSLVSAQDITERMRTELALRQSQERLEQVMRVYDIGLFEHDHLAGTLYWSPELRQAWNLSADEPALVASFRDAILPADREQVEAAVRKAYEVNGDGRFEAQMRVTRSDGALRWVDARSRTFFEGEGSERRPVRTVGAMVDITERRKIDAALRLNERSLREAQSIAHLGNWELDIASRRLTLSDEIYRLFDSDPEHFSNTPESFRDIIHPDDLAAVDAAFNGALAGGGAYQITHRIVTQRGRVKHVEGRCEIDFSADGKALTARGTLQDVTERVETEAALRDSLQEKETLLREVHHRVKNNLQIIASLLHFQAKRVRDPADLAAFADGRDRLRAMILVHEKLYQSRDLSRIDFGNYLRSLVRDLQHSHSAGGRRLDVKVSAAAVGLPIQLAVPCGMILCELLTNVFKYAFPQEKAGSATVSLTAEGALVRLSVQDDGVGLPASFDPHNSTTFGWRLIRNLTAQLGGEVNIERRQGTRVTIVFTNETGRA